MTNYIKLLRPHQWLKNLFIFLPLFFSGEITDIQLIKNSIISFVAFSLAASSIYCFNDIHDVKADRKHPKKCNRPIASGIISLKNGYITMFACIIVSLLILVFTNTQQKLFLISIISFYYLMNIVYCMKLKSYAIVDVMVIATGFVLRILMGGIATQIHLTVWIVLMTFLLALFLAFAKRRDDVVLYQQTGVTARENTRYYNLEFMNQVMTIIASITIVSYIMYTVSPDVMERLHSQYIYLTSIFVLAGIIRYLQITIVDAKSGSPTKILMKDHFIQGCIACWILSFFILIYF